MIPSAPLIGRTICPAGIRCQWTLCILIFRVMGGRLILTPDRRDDMRGILKTVDVIRFTLRKEREKLPRGHELMIESGGVWE